MDRKIKDEVKSLMKLGLPQNLAIVTACANQGKSEMAQEYLDELNEEQQEIKDILSQFRPITEVLEIQKESVKVIQIESTPIKCDDISNEITLTVTEDGLTESLTRQ